MRIALVNPPVSKERMFGGIGEAGSNAAPLSLVCLAAAIRAHGHEVTIIDALARHLTLRDIVEIIRSNNINVAGLTCMTFNFADAADVCAALKRANPAIATIAGGVHIASMAQDAMQKCPGIDICVIGEGEITICKLLAALDNKRDLGQIPGLALRRDGEIVFTGVRQYIPDLDTLPLPAWDLLPHFPHAYNVQLQQIKRLPTTSLITSRGCTAKCIFCDRSTFGNVVRGFSAPYIIQMLRDLNDRYSVRFVNFEDDNFMILKKRLIELCELLIKGKMGISWSCMARVDFVDKPTLEIMKAAGCWMLIYGIETASNTLLNIMNKKAEIDDTLRALEITKAAGLKSKALLIAGSFGETIESLRETREFVTRAPLHDISIHYFTPLPATESHALAAQYGVLEDNWSKMTFFNPVFIPRGLTREDLERHVRQCYLQFYLRPRIIWSYLRRISSVAYLLLLLRTFSAFILYCLSGLRRGHR